MYLSSCDAKGLGLLVISKARQCFMPVNLSMAISLDSYHGAIVEATSSLPGLGGW